MNSGRKAEGAGRGPAAQGADNPSIARVRPLNAGASGGSEVSRLREQFAHRRLGEVMTALGLLRPEYVDRVLDYQAKSGRPFGECCRRLKLVSQAGLEQALAAQFGFASALTETTSLPKDLIMAHEPFGPYAEALRAMSRRLVARMKESDHKVLAVTGAGAKVGRSHVAANLAVAFSQHGYRTLVIDADMRAPSQHRLFDVPQHPGLSRLLGGYTAEEPGHVPFGLASITVVASGPMPPNPSDLLSRNELTTFLNRCRAAYDVVIVDTPASAQHADAEIVASASDCALVVAAEHKSRLREHRSWIHRLSENGVPVAGTLMNSR